MAVTIDGTVGVISPDFIPSSSNIPTNGLFLPTTNALGLATNSTERLRLDFTGNLGLDVTPSAWGTLKAIELGGGVSLSTYATSNSGFIGANTYFNGNWIYKNNGYAGLYSVNYAGSGSFVWYNAPSGTAGSAITFTQAMTLDAGGRLLTPNQPRVVVGGNQNAYVTLTTGATAPFNSIRQSNTAGAACYNTSTYTFTCPIDGFYKVSFIYLALTAAAYEWDLYLNSAAFLRVYTQNDRVASASTLVKCAANDTLSIIVNTGGDFYFNSSGQYTSASYELVG